MADLNSQTSPLTITARMGAATAEPANLPTLSLNLYGVQFAQLPVLELSGDEYLLDNGLRIDPLDIPKLSALELSAQGETFLSSYSGGMPLPVPTLSISLGLIITGDLPVPSLSSTASTSYPMTLSERLPALELSASTGIRCGTLQINPVELSATVIGDLVGRLDLSMPGIELTASGSSPWVGTLDRTLPPLELTIALTGTNAGTLSENIPALTISATASLNDYGTLDADIPSLTITAGTAHQSSMSLDAEIATLIMQLTGLGVGGQGATASAYNSARFTDYVLRHAR